MRFATMPGALATREGSVRYEPGDALLTGSAGDRWPVSRPRFDAAYEPVAPTAAGAEGRYRRRPALVYAKQMSTPFELALGDGRGTLAGAAGDWLVQYAPDDQAVVGQAIFASTYELID